MFRGDRCCAFARKRGRVDFEGALPFGEKALAGIGRGPSVGVIFPYAGKRDLMTTRSEFTARYGYLAHSWSKFGLHARKEDPK